MASKDRAQRIGIWIIAIVMTVGTLGSFVVIILSNDNQAKDQATATEQQKSYTAQLAEYQKQQKIAAQTNADNSEALSGYTARTFDAAAATALKAEVLTQGTGDTVKATDSINASYFGWTSDGKIFDSSKKKGANDTPITFALNGVIKVWTEGLTGVKVGSVVRLTIPSDKAYGPTGSGIIPANAPLEFIVQIQKIDNSKTATK
jgi:FKBP-type peptidyl-prolyl cis-trans isomerase